MKPLFSKFMRRETSGDSPQQIRLCLARFRHLLCEYGRIVALCVDAAEKQSGQYIFDRAYIAGLIDRALDAVQGMVYDLNALSGQRYEHLYEVVENLRKRTADLIRSSADQFTTAENVQEEPEYRLLRNLRQILCGPEFPLIRWDTGSTAADLFAIVQSLLRAAGDSLVERTESLKVTFSFESAPSASFPVSTSVVDLAAALPGAGKSCWIANPLPTESFPARGFLSAFLSVPVWEDPLPQTPRLVAYDLEESMSAILRCREEYDLFDVSLGCVPEANHIYCRFPSGSGTSIAEVILLRSGFVVSRSEREISGWISMQPLGEMADKLKVVAKIAAFLLQSPSAAARRTEEEWDRLLRIHD